MPPEGFSVRLGDLYTLLCAFVFSLHILVISHFVTKVNGVELACGQFVCGSIIASAAVLIAESPTIEGLQGALLPILWAGIMSNGIAYTLQIVGQRGMNETVASLIMSLESAIAVIAGWLLLGEVLSQRELFGCVLMAVPSYSRSFLRPSPAVPGRTEDQRGRSGVPPEAGCGRHRLEHEGPA